VFTSSLGNKVDSLVDSSHGGHINSLLSDNTSSSNTSGVLSRTSIDNCIDENFKRISASKEIDDLENVSNNSDGFNFLSCVSTMELKRSNKSFDNGT